MTVLQIFQVVFDAGLLVLGGVYLAMIRQQLHAKDATVEAKDATIRGLESELSRNKEWLAPSIIAKAVQTSEWAERITSENLELQRQIKDSKSDARRFWLGYAAGLMEGRAALGLVKNCVVREILIEGNNPPSPLFMEKADELKAEISEGLHDAMVAGLSKTEGEGRILGIHGRFIRDSNTLESQVGQKKLSENTRDGIARKLLGNKAEYKIGTT